MDEKLEKYFHEMIATFMAILRLSDTPEFDIDIEIRKVFYAGCKAQAEAERVAVGKYNKPFSPLLPEQIAMILHSLADAEIREP